MKQKLLKAKEAPAAGALLGLLLVLALIHGLDIRSAVAACGAGWITPVYLLVTAAVTAIAAASGYALVFKRFPVERIFACAALSFGVLYLLILPPLSAPDEVRHYVSAYALSNRILGVSGGAEEGLVPVRAEDWFAEDSCGDYKPYVNAEGFLAVDGDGADGAKVLGQTLTLETYELIREMGLSVHSIPPGDPDAEYALSVHRQVVTTPFGYLMPALGVTLARVLGLNTLWLLYLGRLFNLLFFTAAVSYAIRRIPYAKELVCGAALLPMTLHLAASFSYDVLLISGLFCFTAVCFDLAYRAERVTWKDILVLAAIMAIAGPCKMVYAVFMGLCLLIPVKKFGGWGRWALSAACVGGAWVAAMILVNSQTVASYATETTNYIDWAQEEGYSFALVLHQPVRIFHLAFNTLIWQAETWHLTMIGAYLGNTDLVLDVPYIVVMILTGCLLLLAFKKPGEQIHVKGGQRLWVLFLCLVCMGALMFSMLLAWTPLSSRVICGVQGRYFLPFLPAFLLALKNETIVLTKNRDRSILFVMCCADAYVLIRIFSIVCLRQ